jgi:phosphoglycolate phosphatase-like HAD superfamily hydrolase
MENSIQSLNSYLLSKDIIFWDFDGVVKDSIEIKSQAFEQLFLPYGEELAIRVRLHHESNGGLSRFEKIPLYLSWITDKPCPLKISHMCSKYSQLVRQSVIDSPWVNGVREYLKLNYKNQLFILLTATPQDEIEDILLRIDLYDCFMDILGAPKTKDLSMRLILDTYRRSPDKALMIGDSEIDFLASQANSVPFLLRRTPYNNSLQTTYRGPMFDGLDHG